MDEFLFDEDLLQEGLLSEDDAWAMYYRNELTDEQLFAYLNFKHQKEMEKKDFSPFLVVVIIGFCLLCLFVSSIVYAY